MKFSHTFEVDTHDTDLNGVATATAVMRYIQESADLQHEAYGPTLPSLREEGLGFILCRVCLDLPLPLYARDVVTAVTWLKEARGYAYQRYTALYKNGTLAAAMNATWGVMDLEARRLERVERVPLGFGCEDEVLTVAAPARFRIPRELPLTEVGKRTVRYSDCDLNRHLNNTRYPSVLLDYLPRSLIGLRPTALTVNYLHEHRLGDAFTVYHAESDGADLFRTVLADGTVGCEGRIVLAPIE